MRSFQTALFLLLSLLSFAFAEEAYDTTIYLTNTVTQVHTVTKAGPSSVAANSTSTIFPSSYGTSVPYPSSSSKANVTSSATATASSATVAPTVPAPAFTGAAASMGVNAIVAVVAMGAGFLAL